MMRRVKSVMMNVLERVPSRSGHSVEFRSRDHGKFRLVAGQFLCRHTNEQLLHEKSVPGILGDDLNRKPVVRISACI